VKELKDRIKDTLERYPLYNQNQAIFKAYYNLKSSWDNMKQRLYNRAYEIANEKGYFITLTYKDEYLPNEKDAYDHMKQWSRTNCELFISNIDYGDLNGRIHIHSLCAPKENVRLVDSWQYGAINVQGIQNAKKSVLYVTKLVNHAVKDSASHVIRSKKITKGVNHE
jgi:hypothetical protein